MIAAYATQFFIVLLAVTLIILLLRHNLGYLKVIYRRARDKEEINGRIILALRDPEKRFGLNDLQPQFNFQITLLSIAALFAIWSRIHNADTKPVHLFIASLGDPKNWKPDVFFTTLLNTTQPLFPTIGQVFFIISWILMFLIVFTPALAKLVPLRSFHDRNPSTQEFLLELIPPGSPIDRETNGLTEEGSVDKTAEQFAANAFWPSGNGYAEYLSIGAFAVFFFLLAPVGPTHPLLLHLLYYILLLTFAFACSKLLFQIFRFRLKKVDAGLDL